MGPLPERCVLLLADGWHASRDGIYGVNRSLALSLSRFTGVSVYCALLCPISSVKQDDLTDAEKHNVKLIGIDDNNTGDVYKKFSLQPESVFPNLGRAVPSVTHIIGHVPITGEGAVKLSKTLYQESKVLLFYHILPDNLTWLTGDLPYTLPQDTELVHLAEQADVVYSVTDNIHWHFTAKFRNRATRKIDHRLFLPQSAPEVFNTTQPTPSANSQPTIFTLCFGPPSKWQGLDIAACAVNKVALSLMDDPSSPPLPKFIIGNVPPKHKQALQDIISKYITVANLQVEYHTYNTTGDLHMDLQQSSVAILPFRSEPYGNLALSVLSAGLPCLIADNCAVMMLIKRLTSEPENFLVPVTPSESAVRQDASVWRDRLLGLLRDMEGARDQAAQLQTALRRDETTKVTHDNVVCYCLGGINLSHLVSSVAFKLEEDEELELPVLRSLNQFISETLRQCWRLKHHPLTQEDDLYDLLPGIDIPFQDLLKQVTNKIEEHDRRIVGISERTGAFIIYCPTPYALSDLWAMCDVINKGLVETLLVGSCGDILGNFGLKAAGVLSIISGPEFLAYKKELLRTVRPKTAAF